jgi:hypothetical protein
MCQRSLDLREGRKFAFSHDENIADARGMYVRHKLDSVAICTVH